MQDENRAVQIMNAIANLMVFIFFLLLFYYGLWPMTAAASTVVEVAIVISHWPSLLF